MTIEAAAILVAALFIASAMAGSCMPGVSRWLTRKKRD